MIAVQLLCLAGATVASLALGVAVLGHHNPRTAPAGLTIGLAAITAAAWLDDDLPSAAAAGAAALLCALRWRALERRLDRARAEGGEQL